MFLKVKRYRWILLIKVEWKKQTKQDGNPSIYLFYVLYLLNYYTTFYIW